MSTEALQSEMPFAVVFGEPLTEMPRDLYIPPQAMEVFLDAFEGPLDLLLYLIRRQNLNILDIPIAEITRQYTSYIEVMSEMQLDLAGEYLVMAATLAEIKSRMLLPRPAEQGAGLEEDPRAELVRRLQEYERFKRAALNIDAMPRLERDTWIAGAAFSDRRIVRALPEIALKELLVAFRDVAIRHDMFAHHHIQREPLSVRGRMSDILAALRPGVFLEFSQLFQPAEGRMGVAVTFVALLELLREGLVDIVQNELYGPIHLRAVDAVRTGATIDGTVEGAAQAASAADARLLSDSAAVAADDDDEEHE
jgi:segregation and condensation protein A